MGRKDSKEMKWIARMIWLSLISLPALIPIGLVVGGFFISCGHEDNIIWTGNDPSVSAFGLTLLFWTVTGLCLFTTLVTAAPAAYDEYHESPYLWSWSEKGWYFYLKRACAWNEVKK